MHDENSPDENRIGSDMCWKDFDEWRNRVQLAAEPAEQSGFMLAELLIKTKAYARKHRCPRNDTLSLSKVLNKTIKLRK